MKNFRLLFLALSAAAISGLIFSSAPAQQAAPPPITPPPIAPAQSRMGMNLNGPADWNSEIPFNDVFRLSRKWISQRRGAGWGLGPQLQLDARGWVAKLEPECFAETPLLTLGANQFPSGRYVCTWQGAGEIGFSDGVKIVSQTPNRIEFEPNPARGGFFLRLLRTDAANYVRDIRVFLPGTEKTAAQNPFNAQFLARWRGFNTLRFMDWMQTNGSQVREWAERPQLADATWTNQGIPLEVMIDLCNRQNQNGWFCIPHGASDDYVRRFAAQIKAGLKPNLRAYIEFSNEVWNNQFEQAKYAGQQGLQLGIGEKPWDAGWHFTAQRSKQIFAIFDAEFGGREAASKRIARVLAAQAGNSYVAEQILKFEDAGKFADALAIAPYFGMVSVPRAVDANSKIPAEEVQNWTSDQALDYLETIAIPETEKWIAQHRALATRYGLQLVAYEGGQHAVGGAGAENNERLTALMLQINRSERMGALHTRYLDAWRESGGELFCQFASVGTWSKWGSWGLLEHQGDDTPKYRAVVEWNARNGRATAP